MSSRIKKRSLFEEAFVYRLLINCNHFISLEARHTAKLFSSKERFKAREHDRALITLAEARDTKSPRFVGRPYKYGPGAQFDQRIRSHKSKVFSYDNRDAGKIGIRRTVTLFLTNDRMLLRKADTTPCLKAVPCCREAKVKAKRDAVITASLLITTIF